MEVAVENAALLKKMLNIMTRPTLTLKTIHTIDSGRKHYSQNKMEKVRSSVPEYGLQQANNTYRKRFIGGDSRKKEVTMFEPANRARSAVGFRSTHSNRSRSGSSSARSIRTTSGKGHSSLNINTRRASKQRIETENLKMLHRMQSVKS
jgi:hypothetical protein